MGKCSLGAALPIISALGAEAVALPTKILSTHTGGFKGYAELDLTDMMKKTAEHWKSLGIKFGAVYTGYFSKKDQIETALYVIDELAEKGAKIIVDPIMADNGKLYSGFSADFCGDISRLISRADIITPNVTEALLLSKIDYSPVQTKDMLKEAALRLKDMGAKRVVITGVSLNENTVIYSYSGIKKDFTLEYEKLPGVFCGSGDVFCSCLTGLVLNNEGYFEAVKKAADFTDRCVKKTALKGTPQYGLDFEACLREGI